MPAIQTVLLPTFAPTEIKRLNHLPVTKIYDAQLDVPAEIARLPASTVIGLEII
ncbi:MAG: hypothetical protein IT423_09575 [Pirellulaceae bacterium]|nr:hypothetical protein [Pirellulaceae bacterium]